MALRQFGARRESRGAVRRLIDLECGVYSELWGEVIDHRVTDLSEDGLWIETDLLLDIGDEVTLQFFPPDWEEPLYVAGRVMRVGFQERAKPGAPVGMGVAFEALRTEERRGLTQSMRCLRSESSYILGQATLVGVPVGPESVHPDDQPTTEYPLTVVGWSAPSEPGRTSESRSLNEASPDPLKPPFAVPSESPAPPIDAFEGGLDLVASLFGDDAG